MTVKIQWRKQYDEDRDNVERQNTDIDEFEPSITVEDPDSDINRLMARMGVKDGSILPATLGIDDPKYYGDFTDIPDLKEALDRTRTAEHLFASLPAKLRERFLNDPWKLNTWINNPDNWDEAVQLGLLVQAPDKPEPKPSADDITKP